MRLLWDPVGSKAMPAEESEFVIAGLFGGAEGKAMAARIDRRIDRLPGLHGLRLMAKVVHGVDRENYAKTTRFRPFQHQSPVLR